MYFYFRARRFIRNIIWHAKQIVPCDEEPEESAQDDPINIVFLDVWRNK